MGLYRFTYPNDTVEERFYRDAYNAHDYAKAQLVYPKVTSVTLWRKKFCWWPVDVVNGNPAKFGIRWLVPVWYRWFEGHYDSYWSPCTHNWDTGEGLYQKESLKS